MNSRVGNDGSSPKIVNFAGFVLFFRLNCRAFFSKTLQKVMFFAKFRENRVFFVFSVHILVVNIVFQILTIVDLPFIINS